MARSTIYTFLMYNNSGSWERLVEIKDFPDLGGEPEQIDVTTLEQTTKTYIPGVQDLSSLSFTSNYDLADYKRLKALEDTDLDYAVWFGGAKSGATVTPTGDEGKFTFSGQHRVYASGGAVNEAVNMVTTVSPSTEITLEG